MAKGLRGCESHLQRGDVATPTNFVDVAYVQNYNGPNRTRNDIDVTTLDSPGCTREYDPGLKDGGTLDFNLIFNPITQTSHDDVLTDYDDEVTRYWRIKLDGEAGAIYTEHFKAYVSTLSGAQVTPDGDATLAGTLKVAGDITRAIA